MKPLRPFPGVTPSLTLVRAADTHDADLDAHDAGFPLSLHVFIPDDAPRGASELSVKKACEAAAWAASHVVGIRRWRVTRHRGSPESPAGYSCGCMAREDTCLSALAAAVAVLHAELGAATVRVRLDASVLDGCHAQTLWFDAELPRPS